VLLSWLARLAGSYPPAPSTTSVPHIASTRSASVPYRETEAGDSLDAEERGIALRERGGARGRGDLATMPMAETTVARRTNKLINLTRSKSSAKTLRDL
jgi:hypothetical protein